MNKTPVHKTIVKVCGNDWASASRDKRELEICKKLGMNVLVIAKGQQGDYLREDSVSGFRVFRMSTRPLGNRFPDAINRAVSLAIWAHAVKSLNADIISGHDLLGLTIGWLSSIFIKTKHPALIYDSHEFEIERSATRNKYQKWLVKKWEGFLINRCVFSIMVNNSIADRVKEIHDLKTKPIVVRNIPCYWNIDLESCAEIRESFCKQLNVSEDTFLIMYHGGIVKNRGIESLIDQVSRNVNIAGIILGDGSSEYMEELLNIAKEKDVSNRVLFLPAVPNEELWKYVGAANVGMVVLKNVAVNHYYALPNKFFENIQSLTPIIGSNFPEISRLIKQYDIGMLCDPEDMNAMAACIEKMRTDSDYYEKLKQNLRKAKQDLCWENEQIALEEAYRRII